MDSTKLIKVDGPRFPAGYDLLPESPERSQFKKPVQVIHSYPMRAKGEALGHELKQVERKLQNALAVMAQDAFQALPEARRAQIFDDEVRATPEFKTTISRLAKAIEHPTKDTKRIYDALIQIKQLTYVFNVMSDQTHGDPLEIERDYLSYLSELKLGVKDGLLAGEIAFVFPNTLLRLIVQPLPYALIDLAISNHFSSSPTAALYENTQRYISTVHKRTGKLPVDEWIALLCGEGRYQGKFGDFKRYVLKPAMDVIEATASIPYTLEPLETKGPKGKVVALQFQLHLKAQSALDLNAAAPTWPTQLLELLRDVYSLSQNQINDLALTATEQEVQEACRREAKAFARKAAAGETIDRRGKYLIGVLRNLQAGRPKNSDPEDVGDEPEPPAVIGFSTGRTEAELHADYHRDVIRLMQEGLAVLTDEELDSLRAQFAQAHQGNVTVESWIERGWKRPPNPLNSMLAKWLLDSSQEWAQRLVPSSIQTFESWNAARFKAATS